MFTKAGERLIMRGNKQKVPLDTEALVRLRDSGYRFSGHTHPGIMMTDLIASDGDKKALKLFNQDRSVIYNAAGKYIIYGKGE
jgi:hypothetical protein